LIVLLMFLAVVLAPTEPAFASHPTIYDNRVHWSFGQMHYHYTSFLVNNFPQFQSPSENALHQWDYACCPGNPFAHLLDGNGASHIDVATPPNPNWLAFNSAFYDGNADLHMISNYSAYSLTYVNQGAFYTGTGVPPSNRYDAWSAMAEEIGHGQNMNHFGSACYTMSGFTPNGSTCKRVLTQQEIDAACEPYRLVHESC